MYLTSCRDETVDKSLRILRKHRPEASIAIGLAGGYVGHTTAAARSVSDPAVHNQGPAHFCWPRVPHPEDGVDATIAALEKIVKTEGADRIFGFYFEPVQERTGRVMPAAFWPALEAFRKKHDVPCIMVDTATSCYRSGNGPFAMSGGPFKPDILAWWGGAQTGYLHVGARWRVPDPLAMVSTWDGDELSLVREHHQHRAARTMELAPAIAAADAMAKACEKAGLTCRGLGLYRVIEGPKADELEKALQAKSVLLRRFPGGRLAFIPRLDQAQTAAERIKEVVEAL